MDFLSNLAKGGESKPTSDEPKKPDNHQESSPSDLFASAKVLADAAQAQYNKDPEKYDKAKVSAAGADLLHAAADYGKLDETKGVGKYVDQAEDYLRQSSGKSTPAAAPAGEHKPDATADTPAPAAPVEHKTEAEKPCAEKSEASSEGGYGDLMKMAGGFLKK